MYKKKSLATRDKTFAQRDHFKKRAKERYGLDINRFLYKDLVSLIQRGKAQLIERQSRRLAAFWLYLEGELSGHKMRVIYDNQRGTLVTALPPDGPIDFNAEEEIAV